MPIRVLVVDDSAFMRRVVGDAIASQPDMQLVGLAASGLEALLKVEQLQPDVVTLDVEMPEMDGLTALRHLMARYPRPVVMLSSVTHSGAVATVRALTIGAVDFVGKPSGAISLDFEKVRDELLHKIRVAASARIAGPSCSPAMAKPVVVSRPVTQRVFDRLVVIGASTGGPRALSTLVPALPDDGHTAYLVVQHMPAGFTKSLADRLDGYSSMAVHEAAQGDRLAPSTVLVAPGGHHVVVHASGVVELDDGPRQHGVRPAIDVSLHSAAEHFGARIVAVVLTGMGQDGASGAAAVRAAGGYVLAEHESTCVVWGMPRAIEERNLANAVLPLDRMAAGIADAISARPRTVVPA